MSQKLSYKVVDNLYSINLPFSTVVLSWGPLNARNLSNDENKVTQSHLIHLSSLENNTCIKVL